MEQVQADIETLKNQMATQMTQFMEAITAMNRGQEELRALIERPRGNHLDFEYDDISVGQPHPNGTQTNGPYNYEGAQVQIPYHSATRDRMGHQNTKEDEYDNNEDQCAVNNLGFPAEDKKFRRIEDRLKVVEGQGFLGNDSTDFLLVTGVKIPPNFKVPIFDKYTGNTCPKTHVRGYHRKMAAVSEDEKLLMHFFQDSLSGASLEWYMQLERTHVRNWRHLVEAFIKHYQYNVDMAPNRTQLQGLTQGPNDSFKEYAQKWRELAARVQPPMMEREMIEMFTSTLSGHYYLDCSTSANFAELVMYGECIEMGVKMGKIQLGNCENTMNERGKKPFGGYPKKKEGVTNAIYSHKEQRRNQPQVNVVSIPVNFPQQQQQSHPQYQNQQNHQQPRLNFNPPRQLRVFDPIPISYSQLL